MPLLETIVGMYGILALTHLFIQINLSHAHYLRARKSVFNPSFHPSVAVIIPTYNEEEQALEDTVRAVVEQKYPGKMDIGIVNDGSKDPAGFYRVRQKYGHHSHVHFIDIKQNKGKRHAQKHGFDYLAGKAQLIVTIDSDTILDPHAIRHLVQPFEDSNVGAVTGDVKVIKTKNLLSQLIAGRYWAAFHQERAAQSFFGTVLCCSGPLAAYRNNIIQRVKENYISQYFLGEQCTYGDDRHLTNLVLEQGYTVRFAPAAKAWTHVPHSIRQYLKQQTRWNKSFYRELLWTIRMVISDPKKLHPYIIYDLTIMTVLPFLLMISLAFAVYQSVTISGYYLLGYLAVMIGIATIRSLYGVYRTSDWNLMKFPIYSFLHIFLLIPNRLYAIATMKSTKWGTR